MTAPTPAVRSALATAALVVVVGVTGIALHLARAGQEAERTAARGVEARAATLAAALATGGPEEEMEARFVELAALDWPAGLALLDASGDVIASSDAALAGASPWAQTAMGTGALVASRGGIRYAAAARPVGQTGRFLGVVRVVEPPSGRWIALGIALVLMSLVLGALAIQAWYTGPRATAVLSITSERMAANRDGDPRTQVEAAARVLGPLATALNPLARRLLATRADVADSRRQVAALLQINPHYVLIATMDGELIEANPAFYAVTGYSPEAIRGGRVELLHDTFPLEPLLELADRSDREGSSIGGVEYALVNAEGRSLPVVVSLRAVDVRRRKAVLIQATDVAVQKRLERQVAAFSDTLELMVDQRMAEANAGSNTLGLLLNRAGVLLASFDASGGTTRWNGAAEAFSGRAEAEVPHFHSVATAIGLSDADRTRFVSWFWSDAPDPFVAVSTLSDADGDTRQRRMIWRSFAATLPGQADRRTLVGMEVPEAVAVQPVASPIRSTSPSGQGASGDGYRQHEPFEPHLAFGGIDIEPEPTPEAIDEEEAWIRRLASELPDAFGGGGSRRPRTEPPKGGSWIATGPGADV